MNQVEIVEDYNGIHVSYTPMQDGSNIQATLPSNCLAKDCMWFRGNGANSFSFKKSYTHMPNNSETRHMWLRWSNQWSKWMHLLEIITIEC